MKKIGIFYGSATGTTENIARKLAALLGVDAKDVHDVAETAPSEAGKYDILVLGSSTWNDGGLEDDWYDFIAGLEMLDLRGKQVAIFGCGDETMSDTFCSAVGIIHDRLKNTECTFIGYYDIIGYHFNHSAAVPENAVEAVGLLLDEVNHPELTPTRLAGWATIIHNAAEA